MSVSQIIRKISSLQTKPTSINGFVLVLFFHFLPSFPPSIRPSVYGSVEMHKQLLAMNELNAAAIPVSTATAPMVTGAMTTTLQTASVASPLTPLAIPMNQMLKPMAMPMGLSPAGVAVSAAQVGSMFEAKTLTTKLKPPTPNVAAATMLATAVKKNGNKFAPYWQWLKNHTGGAGCVYHMKWLEWEYVLPLEERQFAFYFFCVEWLFVAYPIVYI